MTFAITKSYPMKRKWPSQYKNIQREKLDQRERDPSKKEKEKVQNHAECGDGNGYEVAGTTTFHRTSRHPRAFRSSSLSKLQIKAGVNGQPPKCLIRILKSKREFEVVVVRTVLLLSTTEEESISRWWCLTNGSNVENSLVFVRQNQGLFFFSFFYENNKGLW